MLKMVLKNEDGKPRTIVIGFSHENLDRLRKGQWIRFDSGEVHKEPGVEIIIFSGETEQSIADKFSDLIGPQTQVRISPKLKN